MKAVSDTAGSGGLVPTMLIFDVLRGLHFQPHLLPDNFKRMEVLKAARMELESVVVEDLIHKKLRHNVPAAAETELRVDDMAT